MECLDEETILAFSSGLVEMAGSAERRAEVEAHMAECDECRQLVSLMARDRREEDASRVDSSLARAATTPLAGARGLPLAPVQPGEILGGKFEVEEVLGAGGMGIVVKARHTQLEQSVALKFLLPAACEVPGAVARFLREGKAAAQITSEHVARVMDVGVLPGGAPYLVMEYLKGVDLGVHLAERGTVGTDEAIEYVLQAAEAIAEAHELGIVHRDLKPANLFLGERADGSPLVKVLDFGISKVAGGSRSQLTSASVLMGSPRYMSPEQMVSAKDVDARTDVWALGVILYELVTGEPVWHADTVQGLCALIASSPAPLLRAKAPRAPVLLESVIARCLTKRPSERMASVAALAEALAPIAPEAALTSISRIVRVASKDRSTTGPRSVRAPADKGVSNRTAIILALIVGALLALGVALNTFLARRAPVATFTMPLVATASVSPPAAPVVSAEPPPPASSAPSSPVVVAARPPAPKPIAMPSAVASVTPPAASSAPSRALTDRK